MKTLLPILIGLHLLLAGCSRSSNEATETERLSGELQAQRQELTRLRSEIETDRRQMAQAVTAIQARVEELARTLGLAQVEIWGDGSPTAARLSMAQRSLASLEDEVGSLATELRSRGHSR